MSNCQTFVTRPRGADRAAGRVDRSATIAAAARNAANWASAYRRVGSVSRAEAPRPLIANLTRSWASLEHMFEA
jgi:hypothetical protein